MFFSWQDDKGLLSVTVSGETTLSISTLPPPPLQSHPSQSKGYPLYNPHLFYLHLPRHPLHFTFTFPAFSDLTTAAESLQSSCSDTLEKQERRGRRRRGSLTDRTNVLYHWNDERKNYSEACAKGETEKGLCVCLCPLSSQI